MDLEMRLASFIQKAFAVGYDGCPLAPETSGCRALHGFVCTAAAIVLLSAPAMAANGPTDWNPVSTNAIAAWSRERSAPSFVLTDKAAGKVVFLAEATGLGVGDIAEFVVCGPLSDRAYESMFMSLAKPEDITAAVESLGVPRGVPIDDNLARFWPEGERLEVSIRPLGGSDIAQSEFLKDSQRPEDGVLGRGAVYTGGEHAADGSLVAATNIPCAVFATYNHAPSALQLSSALDQSSAYGRFLVAREFKAGDLVEFSLRRVDPGRVREMVCEVSPSGCRVKDGKGATLKGGTFTEAAEFIRAESKSGADIYLRLSFSPDTPVAFARACAGLFSGFDGKVAKLNGFEKGQYFAKAFLPDASWRNRKQRIAQPFEVYPTGNGAGKFVFVEEYWDKNSESIDPELRPHEHEYKSGEELRKLVSETGRQGEKMFTAFVFLPSGSTLAPAFEALEALRPRIACFYVFDGIEPQPAENPADKPVERPAEPAAPESK